jgi:hypothetical protein
MYKQSNCDRASSPDRSSSYHSIWRARPIHPILKRYSQRELVQSRRHSGDALLRNDRAFWKHHYTSRYHHLRLWEEIQTPALIKSMSSLERALSPVNVRERNTRSPNTSRHCFQYSTMLCAVAAALKFVYRRNLIGFDSVNTSFICFVFLLLLVVDC